MHDINIWGLAVGALCLGLVFWRSQGVLDAQAYARAGAVVFIGVGLLDVEGRRRVLALALFAIFWLSLTAGVAAARRIWPAPQTPAIVASRLSANRLVLLAVPAFVVLYACLPTIRLLASGESLQSLIAGVWATDNSFARAQAVIEQASYRASGVEALLSAVQRQLEGVWYLGLGLAAWRRTRWLYVALAGAVVSHFLTSDGSRTMIAVGAVSLVLFWLTDGRRTRAVAALTLAATAMTTLLMLDVLMLGRQGQVAQGGVSQRVERALRSDFTYGSLGFDLGLDSDLQALDSGLRYLGRILVMPLPRVLWADKPITTPNEELTEAYEGRALEQVGAVRLFTPFGEALAYFGYLGIVFVPFLYGFTIGALGAIYSTSVVYRGLQVQLCIWAFLAMRLTYFNLFGFVIAANAGAVGLILIACRFVRRPLRRPLRQWFPWLDSGLRTSTPSTGTVSAVEPSLAAYVAEDSVPALEAAVDWTGPLDADARESNESLDLPEPRPRPERHLHLVVLDRALQ